MFKKQVVTTVVVGLIAASLFEFVVKPQLKKVMNHA